VNDRKLLKKTLWAAANATLDPADKRRRQRRIAAAIVAIGLLGLGVAFAGLVFSAPAPPPTARELAESLVENCYAEVSDKDRSLLNRPDVTKELQRLGVERGWLDPKAELLDEDRTVRLKYAETGLRFCRASLRRIKEGGSNPEGGVP
jgi:hypothetical protein